MDEGPTITMGMIHRYLDSLAPEDVAADMNEPISGCLAANALRHATGATHIDVGFTTGQADDVQYAVAEDVTWLIERVMDTSGETRTAAECRHLIATIF